MARVEVDDEEEQDDVGDRFLLDSLEVEVGVTGRFYQGSISIYTPRRIDGNQRGSTIYSPKSLRSRAHASQLREWRGQWRSRWLKTYVF